MQPRSKLNRALAITLVAGLGLLVLLGLVFSIARGSQQITSNATALHSADETLRTATVVRAQVGIATHLITIDDHFGTSSEEAIALSVSEARTSQASRGRGPGGGNRSRESRSTFQGVVGIVDIRHYRPRFRNSS
jgi:hypothetical protein